MVKQENNMKKEKSYVNDIHAVKNILNNINWNFYRRGAFSPSDVQPFNCRKHHWFPATFIPEIPFTLIEVLTLPNAVVYDPFGGIGTTYIQALLLNRKPLTTEVCKVAAEYINSLFILFNPVGSFEHTKENVKTMLCEFDYHTDYVQSVPKHILVDKLSPWYSKKTLNQLAFLFIKEASCNDKVTKAAMRATLSAILKTISSQDRGWGCVADNVLPKKEQIKDKDVLHIFENHINRLLDDVLKHLKYVNKGLYNKLSEKVTVYNKDVRECDEIPDNSIDLVVTSPPYPNMTDYITSQRLSYYYLGLDPSNNTLRDHEIGARSRRFREDSLRKYLEDMQKANELVAKKIKSGGYACYVMPAFNMSNENNRSRKRIVYKVLSDFHRYDLIKEGEYERILPSKRRAHNIKWATLEREKIYLFRKV